MSTDLEKVMQDGYALQCVSKQTPAICLAAVTQDGYALHYVKEQTPEICLAAVTQHGWALGYVKEQTPEICIAAVKQDGYMLLYDKEQGMIVCVSEALIARGRNKRSATDYWQGAVTHLEVVIDENGVCNAVAALAKAVENIKEDAHPESSIYANLDFVLNVLKGPKND